MKFKDIRIGIILPTNEPDVFLDMFLPSIGNLEDLKPMAQFQIIFQPPWLPSQIRFVEDVLTEFGWKYLYDVFPIQKQPVNILNLRGSAAELDETVDIYLSLDDDMRFSSGTATVKKTSGQRYLEGIKYMHMFERCGGMDCRGFLGGRQQGQQIRPVWDWCYTMGTGMLFRNFTKIDGFALIPPETRHLVGGHDETLISVVRIERGYFHAALRNNVTYHKTGPADIQDTVPDDYWLSRKVTDANIVKWIRDRYDYPGWDSDPKIKKCPVPYDLYLENGGIDFLGNQQAISALTMKHWGIYIHV